MIEITGKFDKQDNWGFPHVWVPFGMPGEVDGADGKYIVYQKDIQNPESINSLSGIPVYIFHPDVVVVTPDNYKQTKSVGVATDKYRFVEGGGQVLVKLFSSDTLAEIDQLKLTEASPVYEVADGVRIYNHLAILPPGGARGGSKMKIYTEGYQLNLPTNQNQLTINKMEETLGLILANQSSFDAKLSSLIARVDEADKAEMSDEVLEEGNKKMYAEGFESGVAAGEILAMSKLHGYEGADATEAQTHLIGAAFPSLKIEGYSPAMLQGLTKGAIASLQAAATVLALKVATPAVSATATVPALVVDDAPAPKRKSRFPLQTAVLV